MTTDERIARLEAALAVVAERLTNEYPFRNHHDPAGVAAANAICVEQRAAREEAAKNERRSELERELAGLEKA